MIKIPYLSNKLNCILLIILVIISLLWPLSSHANNIAVIAIKEAIGPAVADHVIRGINNNQDKSAIILTIDTPGGLDKSTRQIVKAILASNTPIIGYVSPKGARAASAGTFILYACPIAAMAPGTHLGAASPVSLTGSMSNKKDGDNTMKKKVTNDAIATIKTLAQLNGRDSKFAVKAVKDAATLTAQEALDKNVINLIAEDGDELVKKINGMKVTIHGKENQVQSQPANITHVEQDWRTTLLAVITSPTVAYLLLMLGIYGIFFELMNPGMVLPGVIGAIAIVMALYALHLLPINYAGLSLIILGVIFMLAEAFVPSFGALGIGGVIAFIIGSFLLIDSPIESYQIAKPVILAVAVANGLFILFLMKVILKVRQQKAQNDYSQLIGQTGIILNDCQGRGQAKINGEIWKVLSQHHLSARSKVKVIAVDGLTLHVEAFDNNKRS